MNTCRSLLMASSSPSVSRGRGGLARAESSSRALVGMHRANAQLQQELEKIDRQAFTAVSNIANHQQAMKMSWRRLEAQRNSPKTTRAKAEPCSDPQPQQRRGLLVSSNRTKLYVAATPQIYFGGQAGQPQQLGDTESEAGTGATKGESSAPPPFCRRAQSLSRRQRCGRSAEQWTLFPIRLQSLHVQVDMQQVIG